MKKQRFAAHPAALAAAPLLLACAAPLALAQPLDGYMPMDLGQSDGDTLQGRVGARLEQDNNVLRAPNKVSDQARVLEAGVRVDKRYSLQRITLDAQLTSYNYRDNSALDYTTANYRGAWNFQFTPRLRGQLAADRREYRDLSTSVLAGTDLQRRTERNETAEATLDVGGGWRTLAGINHYSNRSDDPRAFESSPSITSVRIGGGYEFPSGALVLAQLRRGDGSYGDVASGVDFRETEPFVSVRLPASAGLTVEGRLGWLKRKHDTQGERDFDGWVGRASANWAITGKTRLEAGVSRELGAYEFAGGGNVRGWRWYAQPVWSPTVKTAVRLRVERDTRNWNTASSAAPDAGREDRLTLASLAFDWEPVRRLFVTAGVRTEHRNSSLPGLDFSARILSLGARYQF